MAACWRITRAEAAAAAGRCIAAERSSLTATGISRRPVSSAAVSSAASMHGRAWYRSVITGTATCAPSSRANATLPRSAPLCPGLPHKTLASAMQQHRGSVLDGGRASSRLFDPLLGAHARSLHTTRPVLASEPTSSTEQAKGEIKSKLTPAIRSYLSNVTRDYQALTQQMTSISPSATKEINVLKGQIAALNPLVDALQRMTAKRKDIDDLDAMVEASRNENDVEMRKMAQSEWTDAVEQLYELEQELLNVLVPKNEVDDRNAILEVRAGTGGLEASLFSSDMFTMYQNYAEIRGWKFEVIDISRSDVGGFKEASATISGYGVFGHLKFESGVHRVQRVPQTESQGRVHTSTVTVALLPEAQDVDIELNERDLRIETMRASGAGGQHVNKTESAIRVTHIPSGIAVHVQEDRSQHKNRAKAYSVLRARLYEIQREKLAQERAAHRAEQVGTGSRSERIRTYNFPQDRVTDHRVNVTLHGVPEFLLGEGLDEIIASLRTHEHAEELAHLLNSSDKAASNSAKTK
ncbi:peptide chain release factor 1 [Capsaspora owczarzaki ATCC 30864]|uniref:Peptide chain release factor 1 n=1 Tax=Capsaspora owczarzaki (strain ATCC 30864) TaxID=595528 RepID=A0A0D2UFM4_CAPO3|nr:peptide chain release factor 1 [Capsaspora owczarzaki ATCC 30864]KJE93941.1 peptide chain release factor 1 [Capsaspora owczarzaki ATCC 30864]|eukprot:XP_004347397.1 peptide chain release factor 1 [Capsaspora owczarzaki ATCC 30864]